MSCDRWLDLLVDRSANEVSEEETILLEQHLAECPGCRAEELHLGRILAPKKSPVTWSPDLDMARRVWARWQLELGSDAGARPEPSSRLVLPFTRRIPLYWAAAAAALAVIVGLWVGQRGAHPAQGEQSVPLPPAERFTPLDDSRPPTAFATIPGDAISLPLPSPRDTL